MKNMVSGMGRNFCPRLITVVLSVFVAVSVAPVSTSQEVDAVTIRGKLPNEIQFGYEYQEFDEVLDPWQLYKLEYTKRSSAATFIARINHSERFGRWGDQFEIDLYPKLREGTYAYLSAGYSEDSIFPDWRYGAQIYQSLPRSFEVSVGARRLEFENSEVDIFTGSIAKYKGAYYVSLQPFLTARSGRDSLSGVLTVRNYYGSADDYFEFRGSYGERPEEDIFLESETTTTSWSLGIKLRNKISDYLVLEGGAGIRDEEIRPGVRRESLELSAGIRRRF